MSSIFGTGRPSGALGGIAGSQGDRLDRENTRQDISTKRVARSQAQAEYFDYMDAQEARQSERALQIERDKADTAVIPSAQEKAIETNITDTVKTKAERTTIAPSTQLALQKIHTDMTDQQYNDVTRVYKFFDDVVQSDPEKVPQAYAQARAEIIRASADPERAEQWLESNGVTTQFNENSVNALSALSSYGLHDAGTARAEHLLNVEWDAKLKEARIAAKTTSPEDMRTKAMNEESQRTLGNMLSATVKDWDSFQGGQDDDNNYTGDQGAIVSTLALWSTTAQGDQIMGDRGVTPFDYQRIGADMMNVARHNYSDSGLFWGTNNTGDDFNGAAFMNAADSTVALLNVERARLAAHGEDVPLYQLWKRNSEKIMKSLDASHRALTAEGVKPPPPVVVTGDTAGTADAVVTDTPTDAPASDVNGLTTRRQVMNAISDLGDARWTYVAGRKQKSAKFLALQQRKRDLTKTERATTAKKKAVTAKQKRDSDIQDFGNIFKR